MYIGSNAVDDIKIGSNSVDAVYLGDTQVWSAIPADVKAHIARVVADGGTVPNQASMVSTVKKLIAANLWNNCVFFGLPLGGVKKDGNQFVSKVYDLKANADLLQAIGTAQPKYQTDGSLLYDDGDILVSSTLASGNAIRNTTNNFTVCSSFIRTANTTNSYMGVITRATNTTSRCFQMIINGSNQPQYPNSPRFFVVRNGTVLKASSATFPTNIGTKYSFIADWDGTNISLMVNGVVNAGTNELTGTGAISSNDEPVRIGDALDAYKMIGNINKSLIFNKILTATEKSIVNEILSDWS